MSGKEKMHPEGKRPYLPVTVGEQEYVPMTWGGLLAILDQHYPADIFTGESGGQGPRIVALIRRVDELEFLLADVLAKFHENGHPGRPSVRTGWLPEEVIERWRATLHGPSRKGSSS